MEEIRIGVVGLGWVAGAHIETFRQVRGARVTAVCSRRHLDEADLRARYGVPLKAYRDFDALLGDPEIDVIDICTPHPFHPRQAVAAAEAGKHLIIEKPLGISWASVCSIRDAIRRTGVKACVCFECRFSRHFSLVRSIIDQQLLGHLHYCEVDYYHGIGPWYGQFSWNIKKDMGGSSILTAGCHALDALLYFKDSPVVEVTSLSSRSVSEDFAPYEYDTTTVALLKFADGSIGKVTSVIDCHQPYYFHVHLVGSHGSLLDNRFYSKRLEGLSKERWTTLETSPIDSGDVKDHPYLPQFQAFADSLREGTTMPRTDFDTAWETHRVAFAIDRSTEERRTVRLEEMD